MILNVSALSKSFLEKNIINDASFFIEDNEHVALIGDNGAGKTTLLKMISGELEPDSGVIAFKNGATMEYLKQNATVDSNISVLDELLKSKQSLIDMENRMTELHSMIEQSPSNLDELISKYSDLTENFNNQGGYTFRSEINGILKGLGFNEEDFGKNITLLSGGERTRLMLAKVLVNKPDLLILDEPTNHLDLNSVKWLETFLSNLHSAVLIVSHDRYFIDKIATKVLEIDKCKLNVFKGNYSDYSKKKEILRNQEIKAYLNQQKEIAHQEEVIAKLKSFNREKSIKRAESREKALDKIERIDKPDFSQNEMNLSLTPCTLSGNDVLTIEDLSKSFGNRNLYSNVNLEIKRGEHVGIIGDNGTGKTTLLKILCDEDLSYEGEFRLGTNVEIGYYDQEHNVLSSDKTLFEEISDEYPYLDNTKIRNTLAAFCFKGDDVFKQVKDLSGGEKGRLSLAKLMLSDCNFLILDEPTNHLDIVSKEILETALISYEGTLLFVSHDRFFINRCANRILELENQTFTSYGGNYDYYLEKKDSVVEEKNQHVNVTQSKKDFLADKEEKARLRKKENDLKKCEDKIAKLEEELSLVTKEMELPENGSNSDYLMKLSTKAEKINDELLLLYDEWEKLSE